MTAVDTVTGEVVETIGEAEARRLTTEAQNEFRSSADHFGKGWAAIEEAVKGGGHLDLGYRSPGDYLHSEFDGVLSGLDVAARRVAVRSMTEWGLSTRAIAPVVGASQQVVHNDIKVTNDLSPAETPVAGVEDRPSRPPLMRASGSELASTRASGGDHAEGTEVAAPRPPDPLATRVAGSVVGIDGKAYSRPAPRIQTKEERDRVELEQGRRDTCTRIAECVRFLDGGEEYAAIFLEGFYPHEHRFLAEGMRLTPERVQSAIDFLTAVYKGIDQ